MKQIMRELRLRRIPLETVMAAKYQAALAGVTMEQLLSEIIINALAPKKKK